MKVPPILLNETLPASGRPASLSQKEKQLLPALGRVHAFQSQGHLSKPCGCPQVLN